MHRILIALSIVAVVAGCGGAITYKTESVSSGQMLILKSGERVLISGIRAPAEGEEGFQDSRDILRRIVADKNVRLVRRGEAQDGSTVADVYVGEVSVATVMQVMNAAVVAKTPLKKRR